MIALTPAIARLPAPASVACEARRRLLATDSAPLPAIAADPALVDADIGRADQAYLRRLAWFTCRNRALSRARVRRPNCKP